MKKIIYHACLFSMIIFIVASCGQKKAGTRGTITGKLSHAANATVYFEHFDDKGEYILDSAKTDADGNFKLNNKAEGKDYYVIRTDPTNLIFLLTSSDENIVISGDAKNIESTYTIKGSEDSQLINELKKYEGHLTDSLNVLYSDLRDKMPDKKDSAGSVLQKYYTSTMESFGKNFLVKHPESLVSLSVTRFLDQQKDIPVMESLLASLTKKYPGNKYVNDFESRIAELKKVPVGSIAPEIKLNTPDGKSLSLSSLRGKVVLIDFWASWCGPCRKENPHLVDMYRKFKNKNFEIFGVSLDENMNALKDAIRHDNITWLQVSELKKWDSDVVKTYMIDEIPYTIILDKDGKIIAKGLTGDELERKLLEVL